MPLEPRPQPDDRYQFVPALLTVTWGSDSASESVRVMEKGSYWQCLSDKLAVSPGSRAELDRMFEYVGSWDEFRSLWKWRDEQWAEEYVHWERERSGLIDSIVGAHYAA